jgi:hypothetical protein
MATWQFAIHLIPRSRLIELFDTVRDELDQETVDSVQWWQDLKLPADAESFLDSFSARGNHWHKETVMWGDIDSDHIEVSKAESGVVGVYARIDARERNDKFLNGLVGFAVKSDCVFWFPENERIVEPTFENLLSEISRSRAFQFVTDPVGFFKDLESLEDHER